jgi:hypothetical protein
MLSSVHTRVCFTERLHVAEGLLKPTHILARIQGVCLYSYLDEGFSRLCLVPPTVCWNSLTHAFTRQWLYGPLLGHDLFLQFRNLFYADGRTPWTSDQPIARPLPKHRTTQTQNKHTHRHPSMPWVGVCRNSTAKAVKTLQSHLPRDLLTTDTTRV